MKIMGLYIAYYVIMQKMGLLGHISVSNYGHMSIKWCWMNWYGWVVFLVAGEMFVCGESVPEPAILSQAS